MTDYKRRGFRENREKKLLQYEAMIGAARYAKEASHGEKSSARQRLKKAYDEFMARN